MFDKFCDIVIKVVIFIAIGFALLLISYLGYIIYGNIAAPYVISTCDEDYFIREYNEENGYYYATTICGDECKIPIGIAVIKENK